MSTTAVNVGVTPYPAGEYDKSTLYEVKDGVFSPMVSIGTRYFILNKDVKSVKGVAPDSEEGTKYWTELEFPQIKEFTF